MKKLILLAGLIGTAATAQSHYVQGYTRSDGTYVQPHYQTNPNGNAYDNYSSRPNVNPYTGQQGTVNPYVAQQRMQSSYGQQPTGSSYGNPF